MSSSFTPQSVHSLTVSMSNVTSSNGCLGIGTTTPACALDVRGSVNVNGATPFLTNGVAVGTIIYGTWLGPTFATLTHQALWSISLSPGTWVITGGINVTSNSQGIVYFGIGTSNTTVNQGNRVNGPTGNLELALQSTLFVSITSTTTYYGVGYSTATGNWDKEAYTIFQAMKIC